MFKSLAKFISSLSGTVAVATAPSNGIQSNGTINDPSIQGPSAPAAAAPAAVAPAAVAPAAVAPAAVAPAAAPAAATNGAADATIASLLEQIDSMAKKAGGHALTTANIGQHWMDIVGPTMASQLKGPLDPVLPKTDRKKDVQAFAAATHARQLNAQAMGLDRKKMHRNREKFLRFKDLYEDAVDKGIAIKTRGTDLGLWVSECRRTAREIHDGKMPSKKYLLTRKRIKELNDINFDWGRAIPTAKFPESMLPPY
jgi:hypothetical protein